MGVGGSIPVHRRVPRESSPEANRAAGHGVGFPTPGPRANRGLHLAEFERVCLAEALLLSNLAGWSEGEAVPLSTDAVDLGLLPQAVAAEFLPGLPLPVAAPHRSMRSCPATWSRIVYDEAEES